MAAGPPVAVCTNCPRKQLTVFGPGLSGGGDRKVVVGGSDGWIVLVGGWFDTVNNHSNSSHFFEHNYLLLQRTGTHVFAGIMDHVISLLVSTLRTLVGVGRLATVLVEVRVLCVC